MNYIKKQQDLKRKQMDGLEGLLSGALAPVAPSKDFVSYLGDRLTSNAPPAFEISTRSFKWYQYTLMAVISILGGGVFLSILIRVLITWAAWLSLIRQLNRGSQPKIVDV